jgi:hypothetical protein
LAKNASAPAAPQALEDISCQAGYILTPVLTRPEAARLLSEARAGSKAYDGMWDIRLVAAEPAERRERQTPEPPSERAGARREDVAALSEKLDHTYPYERAASLPRS